VEVSDDLSWNKHVENTAKKASCALGFLRRNLRHCSREVKTKCYNTFVRPITEYASCVWDPLTQKNTDKIEAVQRQAARFVKDDYGRMSSVTTMLEELKWKSLEQRRLASKTTMMYRIVNGLIDIPSNQLIPTRTSVALNSNNNSRNSRCFQLPHTRTEMMKGMFFPDSIRLWNSLPEQAVNAPSVDVFKTKVGDITFH